MNQTNSNSRNDFYMKIFISLIFSIFFTFTSSFKLLILTTYNTYFVLVLSFILTFSFSTLIIFKFLNLTKKFKLINFLTLLSVMYLILTPIFFINFQNQNSELKLTERNNFWIEHNSLIENINFFNYGTVIISAVILFILGLINLKSLEILNIKNSIKLLFYSFGFYLILYVTSIIIIFILEIIFQIKYL